MPAADAMFLRLNLPDEAASLTLGQDLALCLRKGDCILLSGDHGMGKTTLARAIIRAFLDEPEAEVPSPTFMVMNRFDEGRLPVSHFDLYRIADPDELEEIGFQEAIIEGVTLIEWPEQAEALMPPDALHLAITSQAEGRSIAFSGPLRWAERLSRTLRIRAFVENFLGEGARRCFLQGDASPRAYEIVTAIDGRRAILMDAPATRDGPIVKEGKRYSELAHLAEDVRPFVAIGEALRAHGLPAPAIYAHSLDEGLLLLQDFGSGTLTVNDQPDRARYEVAIDILATIHGHNWPREVPLPSGGSHRLAFFDRSVFEIEISLLADWYAPYVRGQPLNKEALEVYYSVWDDLYTIVQTGEKSLLLRDYHSPNLIWRSQEEGLHRIGLIDYQDALIGPSAYDVASLCQDARKTVPAELEEVLKQRYVAARRRQEKSFDEAAFERDYAIIAAQRGTRLLGLWPRLKYRDGKAHYMAHMPRTEEYLRRAFAHPVLKHLKLWYADHLGL